MATSSLQSNDVLRAATLCETALTFGGEQGDDELVTWAWVLRGDIRWRFRDFPGAVRAYVLAYYGAFRFLRIPQVPDRYVRAWYDELCTCLLRRLVKLWQTGSEQAAIDACRAFRDGIRPIRRALEEEEENVEVALDGLVRGSDLNGLRNALMMQSPAEATMARRLAARRSMGVLQRLQTLPNSAARAELRAAWAERLIARTIGRMPSSC